MTTISAMVDWQATQIIERWSDEYYYEYEEYLNEDGKTDMDAELLYISEFEQDRADSIHFVDDINEYL